MERRILQAFELLVQSSRQPFYSGKEKNAVRRKKLRIVSANSLGICEHCGVVLSIQDMPVECADDEWRCPECGKEITDESFGCRDGGEVKWVGPGGKWVDKEPAESFEIGNFSVAPASEMRLIMTSPFLRFKIRKGLK